MKSKLLLVLVLGALFLLSSFVMATDQKETKNITAKDSQLPNAVKKAQLLVPQDQTKQANSFSQKSQSIQC